MTTRFKCTTAELITPEFLRLLAVAQHKENQKQKKLSAARRALSICNKLKPSDFKARHVGRIFYALNKLRAV